MASGTGNGWTLTLATTGAIGNIISMTGFDQVLPEVDDSHLGTADVAENMPGDLEDPGEFEVEVEFDTSEDQPSRGVVETITVTSKLRTGESTAAKWAGTGYIKSVKTPDAKNNERSIYKVKIRWDGKTGPTYTASA